MKIIHLRNNSIDRERWDECICKSGNPLIYATSWYLDIVSPHWEALITDNYEYLMPLPVKRRYRIPYLVQPALTQQLGIFSASQITEEIVEQFIKEIPYFSYELNLNESNFYSKATFFPNFVLSLNQSYTNIHKHYSKNTIRNIEKAKKLQLSIKENITAEEFVDFYTTADRKHAAIRVTLLEKLIKAGMTFNALKTFGVYSADNKLIAALCLLVSCNRLIYLLPVSNEEGKSSSAMFLLIDQLIKEKADNELILDFEGSKIDGVARFYKGFGAKNQPYFILKRFRPSFLIGK